MQPVSKPRIAVIGLGKAGLPLAAFIAEAGYEVVGIDVDAARCSLINEGLNPLKEEPGLDELLKRHGGKHFTASPDYDKAAGCVVFIVIVPLFLARDSSPEMDVLAAAFGGVARMLKKGDIVVLETTVPPTTTESVVKDWLEKGSGLRLGDFHLAHSPERIMTGYSVSRLREFPKVIGGVDKESGKQAFEVYRSFIPNLRLVSSARVAEFVKVIEGCYRDVNIALANELFKIADRLDVDFDEARDAANHQYCDIHRPSTGVGGHCIPVYPWFLIKEMERRGEPGSTRLLRTSREINDDMITFWADRIVLECLKLDLPLSRVKICVNGVTYRRGVKETYHSRNLALARLLAEKGLDTYAYDAMLTQKEIKQLGLRWLEPKDADIVFDSFGLTISHK